MKRWINMGCVFIVLLCILAVCAVLYKHVNQEGNAEVKDNQKQESQVSQESQESQKNEAGMAYNGDLRTCLVSLPSGRIASYSFGWPAYPAAQPGLEARVGEKICSNVYNDSKMEETYTVYADLEIEGYAAVLVEIDGAYCLAEFAGFVTDARNPYAGNVRMEGLFSNEDYDFSIYTLQDIFTDIYQVCGPDDIVSIQIGSEPEAEDDKEVIKKIYRTFGDSSLLSYGIEGLSQQPEWKSDQMKERRSRPDRKKYNMKLELHLKNGQAVSVTYDASNGFYICGDNYFMPLTDAEMEQLESLLYR